MCKNQPAAIPESNQAAACWLSPHLTLLTQFAKISHLLIISQRTGDTLIFYWLSAVDAELHNLVRKDRISSRRRRRVHVGVLVRSSFMASERSIKRRQRGMMHQAYYTTFLAYIVSLTRCNTNVCKPKVFYRLPFWRSPRQSANASDVRLEEEVLIRHRAYYSSLIVPTYAYM